MQKNAAPNCFMWSVIKKLVADWFSVRLTVVKT